MKNAIDYLTEKGWKISSDPRQYDNYPKNYGYRNYSENGINYDSFCGGYHRAFDVYSNATNDVPSVTSGTVVTAETHGNFGGTLEVRDANGNDWIYGHLQRDSLRFIKGDKVNQGDIVGLQGSSNYDDNPMAVHLHIQLRPKGTDLSDEKSEVCTGIPIETYDISNLDEEQDKSNNGSVKELKKIMIVAGHGYNDPGAVGNGTNERDFIRANITKQVKSYLEQEGHTVGLYGGSSQSQDMFQDTAYGDSIGNTKDYGLYWVKSQGYDVVVEFHLDAAGPTASGGHTIIPSGLKADSIDTGIQNAIKKHVGVIRGITGRDNLLNCNVAKKQGINYRLVELGFITSSKDMNTIKQNSDAYCKSIAEAIHGGSIGGSDDTEVKPDDSSNWKENANGILYKAEKATFTVTVDEGIITRHTGPWTGWSQAGLLLKGQSINYSEKQRYDGHEWVSWDTFEGDTVYMPVRTWDKNTGKLGPLWGTIK